MTTNNTVAMVWCDGTAACECPDCESRVARIFGTDGDALAIEILLDPKLTPAQRDRRLAKASRDFTRAVKAKIAR